jgi:hypothetical protein
MGGLLGIVVAAQRGNPIGRLVVNDVGPVVEPAAIERIRGYFGTDPTFAVTRRSSSMCERSRRLSGRSLRNSGST